MKVGDRLLIRVEKVVQGGLGLSHAADGRVVLAPRLLPGEEAVVVVEAERRDHVLATPLEVKEPAPERVVPACRHFGACGGCHLQHVADHAQPALKDRAVREAMERAGMTFPPEPPVPSPKAWEYRHRVRFQVGEDGAGRPAIGFHRGGTHEVLPVARCPLAHRDAQEVVEAVAPLLLDCWTASARRGLGFRPTALEIEVPRADGDDGAGGAGTGRKDPTVEGVALDGALLTVHGEGGSAGDRRRLAEVLMAGAPTTRGVRVGGSGKEARGRRGGRGEGGGRVEPVVLGAVAYIYRVRTPGGILDLAIRSGSFAQANASCNDRLVETVLEMAEVRRADQVVELFCGAGNLTLPLAGRAERVVGIEGDRGAVEAARANARRNGLDNVEFLAEDLGRPGWKPPLGLRADVVVLDPPRRGVRDDVLAAVAALGPRRVVYVSCDSPALARDAAALTDLGFRPERLRVVDMFPQTYHAEAVVRLSVE